MQLGIASCMLLDLLIINIYLIILESYNKVHLFPSKKEVIVHVE